MSSGSHHTCMQADVDRCCSLSFKYINQLSQERNINQASSPRSFIHGVCHRKNHNNYEISISGH